MLKEGNLGMGQGSHRSMMRIRWGWWGRTMASRKCQPPATGDGLAVLKKCTGAFGRRGSSNQQYLALQIKAETPNQKAVIMCTWTDTVPTSTVWVRVKHTQPLSVLLYSVPVPKAYRPGPICHLSPRYWLESWCQYLAGTMMSHYRPAMHCQHKMWPWTSQASSSPKNVHLYGVCVSPHVAFSEQARKPESASWFLSPVLHLSESEARDRNICKVPGRGS